MGYYTKVKKDFSFRKIKFKGIECYEGDGNSIRVTVTGTAQMIRQILKSQYPKYSAEGTWVKTRKFANGDAIDVYLNRFPEDVYKAVKADLDVFDSYAVNHQNAKRTEIKTDDGLPIEAYTKYLHIDNVPPYGSKEKNEAAPDWEKILKGSTKEKTTTPNDSSKFSKGELLRECGGWAIYRKTLPDGRIVYSAFKNKETAPNKTDWNTIKSEVYMQSGFKYGRFGNFERWGSMTDNDENLILNALCEVLTKYYSSTTPNTPSIPQPTTDEAIDVYVDGDFIQKVANETDAFVLLNNNFGTDKFTKMMTLYNQVFTDREAKKIWVFRESFIYGKSPYVPRNYGNLLQSYLAEKGFKVFVGAGTNNNSLVIYKADFGNDKILISDLDGEFKLTEYGNNSKIVGFVNYQIDKTPLSPLTLADSIIDMYNNYYPNSNQNEPQTDPFNINESYKSLPANPKLEYCEIINAEGFIDYADTFPKKFQSFTALTKYIADNIGEIPTQGYDKHRVEWKWKFEDSIGSSRFDVSEREANPVKYPNLYAGEKLRMLCYEAWAKLDSGGEEDANLKEKDEFYGTLVGKEGFELSTDQFNTILTDYLTYYKKDDDKRFLYITPEDRLKRFKDVYPRLIAAFEEKVDDKEEIIATIEALQYLADAGDDEAKTTIEALQYLI